MNESKLSQDCEPPPSLPPAASRPSEPPLIIASSELFQGRSEIWIEHGEAMYRLRHTGTDKLYLSK